MSLMKTLAKVAVGVAIAKGVKSMTSGKGSTRQAGQVADDGLFRGPNSPGAQTGTGNTGLEGMMDSILGGGSNTASAPSGGASGGIGGLLEQLAGGGSQSGGTQRSGGGLGDLLGSLAGGASGSGGLGDLLGGLAGQLGGAQKEEGSFGDVLSSQFDTTPEPAKQPSANQEAAAGLMLAAMIQAAKSDGKFDKAEHAKLMDKLGDVSAAERDFVRRELDKPVDVRSLASAVPQGLEAQTYMMSVLGIDLDSRAEAEYLHKLATEMALDQKMVNKIHDHLGVTRIYA